MSIKDKLPPVSSAVTGQYATIRVGNEDVQFVFDGKEFIPVVNTANLQLTVISIDVLLNGFPIANASDEERLAAARDVAAELCLLYVHRRNTTLPVIDWYLKLNGELHSIDMRNFPVDMK